MIVAKKKKIQSKKLEDLKSSAHHPMVLVNPGSLFRSFVVGWHRLTPPPPFCGRVSVGGGGESRAANH